MALWKKIAPKFSEINDFLNQFTIASFHNDGKVTDYVEFFSLKQLLNDVPADETIVTKREIDRAVSIGQTAFSPIFSDLARLHYLALKRKAITILEFGSGYSTVTLAHATKLLSSYFFDWCKDNTRVENPFHVYSVEEEEQFREITQKQFTGDLENFVTISLSSVELLIHDNRFATIYSEVPNVSPDLIYIDGPSQFSEKTVVNGFSIAHRNRMPMSADILRMEFFFEPGTLVLVDGRTANARFLRSYLKQSWKYRHDVVGDVHYFELNETPLGRFNKAKLDFCLDGTWLLN